MNIFVVGIYLRKSRADIEKEREALLNGTNYDTLQKHRGELLRYARKQNFEVVEIYEELVSADTIEGRPEMKRLLSDVKKKRFDAVLVVDYDRLSRGDKTDQGKMEQIFKESDTLIITPSEVFDLSTEEGEFKADTKGFIARIEYRQTRSRMLKGKVRSTYEGKDISNKQPFGYDKDPITKKLVPNELSQYVPIIFELYDELEHVNRVVEELFIIGIPTKTGKDKWDAITLTRMLQNPKYIGTMFFNKKSSQEYVEVPNSHPALIDEDLFSRVQNKLASQSTPRVGKSKEMRNPFAGIQTCMKCGSRVKMHILDYKYIRCTNKLCSSYFIRFEQYEKAIIDNLKFILEDIEIDVDVLEAHNEKLTEYNKRLEALEKERSKLNTRLENIYLQLENGNYTTEIFNQRMIAFNADKNKNEQAIQDILDLIQYENTNVERMQQFAPSIRNTLDLYQESSVRQKNTLLKSFIKEIKSFKAEKGTKTGFDVEIILKEIKD